MYFQYTFKDVIHDGLIDYYVYDLKIYDYNAVLQETKHNLRIIADSPNDFIAKIKNLYQNNIIDNYKRIDDFIKEREKSNLKDSYSVIYTDYIEHNSLDFLQNKIYNNFKIGKYIGSASGKCNSFYYYYENCYIYYYSGKKYDYSNARWETNKKSDGTISYKLVGAVEVGLSYKFVIYKKDNFDNRQITDCCLLALCKPNEYKLN